MATRSKARKATPKRKPAATSAVRRALAERDEALKFQAATGEILKVIRGSPSDTQPVFEMIVRNAVSLCNGFFASAFRFDGERLHLVATSIVDPVARKFLAGQYPRPPDKAQMSGRAILARKIVRMEDALADPLYDRRHAEIGSWRRMLGVPMMDQGEPIGVIVVSWADAGPIPKAQEELLKTFADQAVIAIENARLFKEVRERNAELKQSLDFQGATGGILTSISSSVTDAQPVFEAIVDSVLRLFDTRYAAVFLIRGEEELHLAASKGDPDFEKRRLAVFRQFRASFPQRIDWSGFTGKALRAGEVSQIAPIIGNPEATPQAVQLAKDFGYNAMLLAPLMREGKAIGAIGTTRPEGEPFDAKQLALFEAFAAQAVIAIENARLFNETKEALERQTATAEILETISKSPTKTQPVFDIIAQRALALCEADSSVVSQVRDRFIHLAASHHVSPEGLQALRDAFPMGWDDETATSRAARGCAVVHIEDVLTDPLYANKRQAVAMGYRSCLAVPMVCDTAVIGVIFVGRARPGRFGDNHIALLKTFADQAVIAIENARLFNETKEALEKQTATAEILSVISGTPTDTQPVFEAIVRRATKLCEAAYANVFRYDGERLHWVTSDGWPQDLLSVLQSAYPRKPDRSRAAGRVILDKQAVRVRDTRSDPDYDRDLASKLRYRRMLGVPLMRLGEVAGVITVGWAEPGPIEPRHEELLRTFAAQAVIAIENARLFKETKEALERQTASADILASISASIADTQPVFDAIVTNLRRLLGTPYALVALVEGDQYMLKAIAGDERFVERVKAAYPWPAGDERMFATRAVRTREVVQVCPITGNPDVPEKSAELARQIGYEAIILAPLMRQGAAIGYIGTTRVDAVAFDDKHVSLIKSFADQAVIAIENVRLFNELQSTNSTLGEALEQQTATAEILRVMSGTPTDTKPVFDAIVKATQRVISGQTAVVMRQGSRFVVAAYSHGRVEDLPEQVRNAPLDPKVNFPSRAILDADIVHVTDWDGDDVPEHERLVAKTYGVKSGLFVPFLREGVGIGALVVLREDAGRFAENEIALLQSFADQAVIAIENVRLFNETKESLEQQTATANILRVISRSPTDVQPVFDAILESATRLCGAPTAVLHLYEGDERFRPVAVHGGRPEYRKWMLSSVLRIGRPFFRKEGPWQPAQIDDLRELPEEFASEPPWRANVELEGIRTLLNVPLVKDSRYVGCLTVYRREVRRFTDKDIALLQTFGDQAVIAMENVRLFNETKEALERQTATSGVLRVISTSPTDVQPVFDSIAERAAELCSATMVTVSKYDGQLVHPVAFYGASPEAGEALRDIYPLTPGDETVTARAIRDRAPAQIPDVLADPRYMQKEASQQAGFRSMAAVPMLRDENVVGAIAVTRAEPGIFSEKQIELLKTFADQAVIATENVRLFKETKEALEQQTATSEILTVISSSPTDVQPVFGTIIRNAVRLGAADLGTFFRLEHGMLHVGANYNVDPGAEAAFRASFPQAPSRDTLFGRAVLDRTVVTTIGWQEFSAPARERARLLGICAGTAVPLLRHGEAIGVIVVGRGTPTPFSAGYVALLKTFADQAVIAIENVRLFKELEARTHALTRSVEQLTALGEVGQAIGSSLELETVLKTIVSNAVRLTGIDAGVIYEYDEARNVFELRASENFDEQSAAEMRQAPVRAGEGAIGRAVATRAATTVQDTHAPGYPPRLRELLDRQGFRAVLAVPLVREEHTIGALMVLRKAPGAFSEEIVELLGTLAAQSALAIQNARLFREIAEKGAQLEVASQHKSQFLASMSHELRTPLNALLGFNEMILGEVYGDVPADMKPPLAQMQASGKHLLRLINNVLDLAKIEAGRMELALSDYSVHETVESVRSTLSPLAADKGLDFIAAVPEDVPLAHGDAGRITQCLMNLAGNALKFTKAGKVEISVASSDAWLRYSVADTGIGIPPEKMASLFTEFKQTDATIASEYGGTGLGLSITKKFVEMHGGRIWAESEAGKGSRFIFEIPVRAGTA